MLSMGYNFGCRIACDTLFDSTSGFSGLNYTMIECLRIVAMATSFGAKIAITGFVCMIATRQLVMERVGVDQQNADIADGNHF